MNDAAQKLIGRTVGGRFRLTHFLGEGAMASVFRGEQDAEPRDVAVKIMHPELLRDDTFAKRFTREAKAAARIEHRNTVRILEHGVDGRLLYLAMELCAGQDLFDVLAHERRLPEARAARIVAQICGALTAAHAHGIVHRDLKPENVMILPDPDEPGADLVKVLDFGIAKILERERRGDEPPTSGPVSSAPPSSVLTMVGTLVGTPDYMSPEQCLGMPVDARSDVYSCGVLLFQVVTGKLPFPGSTPVEVMMQHADKPPPAPSTLLPGIHAGLEKVILRALGKAPAERQQSAAELGGELAAILPELATGSRRVPIAAGSDRSAALPGAALPGVPAAVVITAPLPGEAPPETLRSPAQTEEEAAKEGAAPAVETAAASGEEKVGGEKEAGGEEKAAAAVGEKAAPAVEKKAAPAVEKKAAPAFERTLAVAGEDRPVAVVEKPVAIVETKPAATVETKPAAAFEEGAVAATDPPRDDRKPTRASPPRTTLQTNVASEWPNWAFVIGMVIVCALIWLARYLRFG